MILKFCLFLFSSLILITFFVNRKVPELKSDVNFLASSVVSNKAQNENNLSQKKYLQAYRSLKNPILQKWLSDDLKLKEDKHLIDNWNLENSGLSPEDLAPLFKQRQPRSIVYYRNDEMVQLYPLRHEFEDKQSEQILFIGDEKSIQKTAKWRQERASTRRALKDRYAHLKGKIYLPQNAYEVVVFSPGKRDSGETLVPVAPNILSALQGPDYFFENVNSLDSVRMHRILSTVLSCGHGGEVIIKIKDNGFLLDEPGFDFTIYENAFRIAGTKLIFQEFAYVGISESLETNAVKWFDCDPLNNILQGCVGAVPTAEGGDSFDLAELGVNKIKYIWIKDTGQNKNFPSQWPTEGVDLDAMRFSHAYSNE